MTIMKRIYFNKIMKGVAAAAVLFGAASCSDDLDYELFTKYTYLMNNGWQENIEMEINEDNTQGHQSDSRSGRGHACRLQLRQEQV